jgi:hypothetical protein
MPFLAASPQQATKAGNFTDALFPPSSYTYRQRLLHEFLSHTEEQRWLSVRKFIGSVF